MIINELRLLALLLISLVNSFEIDDAPFSSTDIPFVFTNGKTGRFSNQTDDIVSTIYSTVASISKDLDGRVTDPISSSGPPRQDSELRECRGSFSDKEYTVRPNNRVCDYVVSRNHSEICSLELTLIGWNGECRESWLEAAGKLECGTLTGKRIINFDRSSISLRMRSPNGILIIRQIPCSNQITPAFADNVTLPLLLSELGQNQYPEPYIPPNLRPTVIPSTQKPNFPSGSYLPTTQAINNLAENEIPSRLDSGITIQQHNSKYPVTIAQQNYKGQPVSSLFRPQTIYPGMRYGPPEFDRSSGVVISSPGYPKISPYSECSLLVYPNTRYCSPFIYFDYFEVGNPNGSPCQSSRLEIGGNPLCGCLTGMSWQVPQNIFLSDGSLSICFKGQGRFLLTIHFNTCQSGYNPYPPNLKQPWRCQQTSGPQPYPINPYPIPSPQPYPVGPSNCHPDYYPCTNPPTRPIPQPQPPRPLPPPPLPGPVYPYPPRQPSPQPPFPYPPKQPLPQPPFPYPPKQPNPQPPFPYPPQPSPQPPIPYPTPSPIPAPQPFPGPRPIPIPQPQPPQPYPEPYPPCQIIRIPQGSINCAPLQPQYYCYRFEPPQGYCQMAIRLEEISMTSKSNCEKEYVTTGLRNPRICQENMENIPFYVNRGEYLHSKLMPGSSIKASFHGLPCSCNVEYKQPDFTLRATPSQQNCQYIIHKSNEGVCSLEMTFENVDLECGYESLIIDGKSYCGLRVNERLEVPFIDPKFEVLYQRTGTTQKPGSFSISVSQKSRCINSFSSGTGRDIKYLEECALPLTGNYGNIDFPASQHNSYQYSTCSYQFQPKQGYCYVRVDFDDVDIPNTLDCTRYFININDIKYCGNTLTSMTKVLVLDEERGSKISYKADKSSRWRFTYSLLPCKQEILGRAQNLYNLKSLYNSYSKRY